MCNQTDVRASNGFKSNKCVQKSNVAIDYSHLEDKDSYMDTFKMYPSRLTPKNILEEYLQASLCCLGGQIVAVRCVLSAWSKALIHRTHLNRITINFQASYELTLKNGVSHQE